ADCPVKARPSDASSTCSSVRRPTRTGLTMVGLTPAWSHDGAAPEARRREGEVVVRAGELPLAVAQIGSVDGRHQRPVTSDRTALEAPPAQAHRLHRGGGNPDRREQVARAAPND